MELNMEEMGIKGKHKSILINEIGVDRFTNPTFVCLFGEETTFFFVSKLEFFSAAFLLFTLIPEKYLNDAVKRFHT